MYSAYRSSTFTFVAASKHTKPMLKSMVSPIRWLSKTQAYVLHCKYEKIKLVYYVLCTHVLVSKGFFFCLMHTFSIVYNSKLLLEKKPLI